MTYMDGYGDDVEYKGCSIRLCHATTSLVNATVISIAQKDEELQGAECTQTRFDIEQSGNFSCS